MGVDQPRQQGAPVPVDYAGGRIGMSQVRRAASDQDFPVIKRDAVELLKLLSGDAITVHITNYRRRRSDRCGDVARHQQEATAHLQRNSHQDFLPDSPTTPWPVGEFVSCDTTDRYDPVF